MKRLLIGFAVAVVPLIVVVSAYVLKFHGRFADDQALWSDFGQYVGGTLGAIYGLLAFLGVLYSVHVQRQQATASQLQSLLDSTAKTIDSILNARPAHGLTPAHQFAEAHQGARITVDFVLNAAAARRLTGGLVGDAAREQLRTDELNSIGAELYALQAQFLHFTHCMSEFRKAGGGQGVEDVYRTRYQTTALQLDDVGRLDALSRSRFEVDDLRQRQRARREAVAAAVDAAAHGQRPAR